MYKKTIFWAILVVLLSFLTVSAQDTVDFGLWSDVQFSHAINKTTDLNLGVRFDTKRNTRSFAEQRIYSGFTFKSKDGRFTVSPWVVGIKNFARVPYYEFRPQVTVGYKFTTANKINITPRVRLEYHAKRDLKNDGRIVPILSIDRKLSKNWGVFNTNEFWIPIGNSKDVAKYRKRLFFGATRTVNPHLSVDLFYLYQRDEQIQPKNSHKLGITWKIR